MCANYQKEPNASTLNIFCPEYRCCISLRKLVNLYQITRRPVPEVSGLNTHHWENLKFQALGDWFLSLSTRNTKFHRAKYPQYPTERRYFCAFINFNDVHKRETYTGTEIDNNGVW